MIQRSARSVRLCAAGGSSTIIFRRRIPMTKNKTVLTVALASVGISGIDNAAQAATCVTRARVLSSLVAVVPRSGARSHRRVARASACSLRT